MKTYTPHDYQKTAIQFVDDHPRAALFLEMGLGKTSIVETAVCHLLRRGEVVRVLVIGPKRVAEKTWHDEQATWAHTQNLVVSHIGGTPRQREDALNAPAHIFTIGRDNVKWLVDRFPVKWPFDVIVIDESDSFKDPSSIRFRSLRRVTRKAARVLILSGTPMPNAYLDLWSQFHLIDPAILGQTFGKYREEFFVPDRRSSTRIFTYKLKPGAKDAIEARIRPYTLSLRAADYLTLPKRIDNVRRVALTPAALARYRTLEKDLVLSLGVGGQITAANAAVLAGKLAQAANGAVYDEDRLAHVLHDDKLDALVEILDTAQGNSLVAYTFQHDRDRILARIPSAVALSEPGAIDAWNRGEIKVGIAHPRSLGHGLNLQHGGQNVVWFGLTWSSASVAQFNARLYRQGQTKPVIVTYLAADQTIDGDILDVVQGRTESQDVFLNNLRQRAERLIK